MFTAILQQSQSDLVMMGHTHLSFKKRFDDGRWAVNCGSVGRSKEENRLASYAIITMNEEKIIPEIVQIEYPLEETVQQIELSGIPDYYASFLRNEKVSVF